MSKRVLVLAAAIVGIGVLAVMVYLVAQQPASPRDSTAAVPDAARANSAALDTPSPGNKTASSKLTSPLDQIDAAFRSGDSAALNRFAGERAVDLKKNQVRVILEMDVSPDVHAVPGPKETVILSDGRQVEVQQGSTITIRADLAAAIAAAGATYETASGEAVQVLTPFSSLQALAAIPGVRIVRLSYQAK